MEVGSPVSAVRSQRVVLGNKVCPAVVTIKDGRIHKILPDGEDPDEGGFEVRRLERCVCIFPASVVIRIRLD